MAGPPSDTGGLSPGRDARERSFRWMPSPGWGERGGYGAIGHANSVPRFHLTWGTGPGVLAPFVRRLGEARQRGLATVCPRHRVDELTVTAGAVDGAAGKILEPSAVKRGEGSSREEVGGFTARAPAVLVASGASAPTSSWCAPTGRSVWDRRPSG